MKQLYIVYLKDEDGLCGVDLFVSDSEESAINKFKEEHLNYTYDLYGNVLDIKVVDECDGYKILVEAI